MMWDLARERAVEPLLQWVWPHSCPLCGGLGVRSDTLCSECWSRLDFLMPPQCEYCGAEVHGKYAEICEECYDAPREWDFGTSLLRYSGKGKSMVLRLKNMRSENLAPIMAKLIYEQCRESFDGVELLVPMPLHWTKMLRRGFNQASYLAHALSKITDIPVSDQVLKRARKTRTQIGLKSFEERHENLHEALVLHRGELVTGKHVMLIDDVMTSGASLEVASVALRNAEPKAISVCAFARAGIGREEDINTA